MMNWTFFFHQNMVTLAFFSQINPLYSLQPPTFLKQVAKKLPQKKTLELQKLKKNEFHFNNSCYVQPKKRKKNLILATTYESYDNSNLMKYKNTATIIVK